MAKDTDAEALKRWFGGDGVRIFRRHRAFDPEGVFIGDASYLFVPDNPRYEGSVKLLFDEHGHPISQEQYRKMSDEQKSRCQWRRCYKMVTLLHTNSTLDFFLFVAVRVVLGNDHGCPVLYALVEEFVQTVGKGVMKRLILDRGFLDGEAISQCKEQYGIDILIPIRRNMDICADAMALFQDSDLQWVECKGQEEGAKKPERPQRRPRAISKREEKRQKTLLQLKQQQPPPPPEKVLIKKEAAAIGEFRSWSSCNVPLCVVANREHYADGHQEIWFLIDTKKVKNPEQTQQQYHLRLSTEERYRQLKCFSDLTHFTSRAFSMVVNQVVFIMLAYNLLQICLLHRGRKELNQKTLPRIRQELLPSDNHIIVYYQNYYAMFASFELIGFVVMLQEEPRKKIAAKCQRIGREQSGAMQMTFTEGAVLKVLHAMIHRRWPKGCIYLFPTLDTVTDFSASRFNPLIRDNPEAIGQYIRDTNRANLKRIGDDFLYFRSGRLCQEIQGQAKTSAGLISVPGDHAVHDEYDLMSQRIDEFVDGRLAKSEIKTKTFLSNPTLPDFGISAKFDESDQRYWFAKCGHCGAWTCFDDEDCTHRCSLSTAQLVRNYIASAERRISWGTYVEGGEQIIKHAKEVLARLSN